MTEADLRAINALRAPVRPPSHEILKREPIITTHKFPDMDAYTSVWLLKRFSPQPFWRNAKIEFVEMGKSTQFAQEFELASQRNEPVIKTANGRDIAITDTGYGYFDHHQQERTGTDMCASSLMLRYIKEQNPALLESERVSSAVSMVVDHVLDIDHLQQVYWEPLRGGEKYLPLYQVSDAIRQSTSMTDMEASQRDARIAEVGGMMLDATLNAIVSSQDNRTLSQEARQLVTDWYEDAKERTPGEQQKQIEATKQFLDTMQGPDNLTLRHSGLSVIHVLNGLAASGEAKIGEISNLILQSVHEFREQQILPTERLIQDAIESNQTVETIYGPAILLRTQSQYAEIEAYRKGFKIVLMQFPDTNYGRIYSIPQDKRRLQGQPIDLSPVFHWLQENDPMQKQLNQEVVEGKTEPEDGWYLFKGMLPVSDNAKRPSKREPQINWEELLQQLPAILTEPSQEIHG